MVKSEIPNWAEKLLDTKACDEIEAAVRRAEMTTAAEIVPMFVHSSISLLVPRRILFVSLLVLIVIALDLLGTSIDFYSTQGICLELGLGIAALLLSFVAPLPGWLVKVLLPKHDLQHLVELRAELEFYRQGINGTDRNSGVLMFVSLTERRAVVLADKLIANKLPASTWDEVLSTLLHGLQMGQAAKGFVDAIDLSAKILSPHFPRMDDDKDELSNRLIIK